MIRGQRSGISKKRGLHPAFLLLSVKMRLAPVTFNENPLAMTADPVMSDPAAVGMWGTVPPAGNPDITASVPALVSVDPDVAAFRRWRTTLNDRWRRADAYGNLRERRCRGQAEGKKKRHCKFFHGKTVPPVHWSTRNSAIHPGVVGMNANREDLLRS